MAADFDVTDGERALFLGALVALLHRHTEQKTIAIDGRTADARGGIAASAWTRIDAALTADRPIASVAAEMAAALDAAAVNDADAAAANVAVTFVPGGASDAALAPGSDEPPAKRELHFIVALAEPSARTTPSLRLAYDDHLFRPATLERLLRSLRALFDASRADPGAAVRALPLLAPEDAAAVTAALASAPAATPPVPVHQRFQVLARAQPDAPACTFKDRTLSYAALDEQSSRLAGFLRARGVERGVPVAVCVRPSTEVPTALLAIFKAGGVYLPIDPTHPPALISMMLDEARPRVVLTESAFAALLPADRFESVYLDHAQHRARITAHAPAPPDAGATLEHPSHLIYTSGTTGRPKGVLATHANLSHYVDVARATYRFEARDVFCALARYTFSISLFELLSPLTCGGRLKLVERDDVLDPERLARALDDVTVLHAGPSLLGSLFRHLRASGGGQRFPHVRHASSGGDLVAPPVIEEMKRVFDRAEIWVIYGCTEVSCMGTTYPVPRATPVTRTWVGKPFPGVGARVVDARRERLPFGVVGEIALSGAGVVPGYFSRPELTAEKMVEIDGERFYLTGDVGRVHPDGNIEILGRRDFQVQVRGIRVELPGIESTIRELELCAQCAVVAERRGDGEVRLVAFLVGARETDLGRLRRALGARLPDYMLPHRLVPLEGLPLTPNGKLDRQRLAVMTGAPPSGAPPAPPSPAPPEPRSIALRVAATFAFVLGARGFGLDDDFFERGGDSLLAVTALEELRNRLGVSVPPGALFERPTPRALAAHIEGRLATDPRPIPLNDAATAPALFMLLGVHIYRELARRLEGRYAVHGVYSARELGMFESAHAPSVTALAGDYVAMIRRQQPHGPYRIGGLSFGGIVAYEVARQLRAAGEEVSFLGLVDATLPQTARDRLRHLAALPAGAQLRVLWARLRAAARALLPDARAAAAGIEPSAAPLEQMRERGYRVAALAYAAHLPRFDGRATLVVAGRRLEEDPLQSSTCGWTAGTTPALDAHTVDAHHLTLLREPKVGEVAAIFLRALAGGEAPLDGGAHPGPTPRALAATAPQGPP